MQSFLHAHIYDYCTYSFGNEQLRESFALPGCSRVLYSDPFLLHHRPFFQYTNVQHADAKAHLVLQIVTMKDLWTPLWQIFPHLYHRFVLRLASSFVKTTLCRVPFHIFLPHTSRPSLPHILSVYLILLFIPSLSAPFFKLVQHNNLLVFKFNFLSILSASGPCNVGPSPPIRWVGRWFQAGWWFHGWDYCTSRGRECVLLSFSSSLFVCLGSVLFNVVH